MDLGLHPHHLRGNGLHLDTGSSSSKPDTTEASDANSNRCGGCGCPETSRSRDNVGLAKMNGLKQYSNAH